uniref:Uncharacterized protein n=1 Tax=Globisporangium ultimum (strain ATCC 200006 / CBS 805.95 / DAOM BR144) TaxID=431595 RepID=K3WBW2_GLOUD
MDATTTPTPAAPATDATAPKALRVTTDADAAQLKASPRSATTSPKQLKSPLNIVMPKPMSI